MAGVVPDREQVYRRRHRLTHAREFRAAYALGVRRSAGPLTVYVRVNDLPVHRLGLSVGRRVGGAVVRNRLKRLLREAFRLRRGDFRLFADNTVAFDVVILVRPHRLLVLAEYERLLGLLVTRACAELERREQHEDGACDGR